LGGNRSAFGPGAGLRLQLAHPLYAATGHGLIGRGKDPSKAEDPVQGKEAHERNRSGAVRVGNDASVVLQGLRVNLRDNQRHTWIHAKGAGIIHHHAAPFHRLCSHRLTERSAHGDQGEIQLAKGFGGRLFDRPGVCAYGGRLASRTGRCKEANRVCRECTLQDQTEQFLTDSAGGAKDAETI
jgi:hypothetical protein